MEPGMKFKISINNDDSDEALGFSFFDKEGRSAQRGINDIDAVSYNEIASAKKESPGREKSIKESESFAGSNTDNGGSLTNSQREPNFIKAAVRIPVEKYIHCQSIINSCGSMINKSFYAREINYECVDDEAYAKPFE